MRRSRRKQRARAAVLALALVVASVACGPAAPGTFDPNEALARPPRPMPSPVDGLPVQPQPGGPFFAEPLSQRILVGVPYDYEVHTHCGFTDVSFDVDGAFWEVLGPRDDGQGNPIAGLGNPTDKGVVLLIGDGQALWRSAGGVVIRLQRLEPGPVAIVPCD